MEFMIYKEYMEKHEHIFNRFTQNKSIRQVITGSESEMGRLRMGRTEGRSALD